MSEPERASNHADESIKGEGGSNVTSIRLVGMDQPFFTALAAALGLFALLLSIVSLWMTMIQLSSNEYWLQRSEAFLEQLSAQGVKVPNDLLRHKE